MGCSQHSALLHVIVKCWASRGSRRLDCSIASPAILWSTRDCSTWNKDRLEHAGRIFVDSRLNHRLSSSPLVRTRTYNLPARNLLQELSMATIQDEIAAFDTMRSDLEATDMGRWVVIHDRQLIDLYDSFDAAADDAVRRFGTGPYLIRQIGMQPMVLPASVMFHRDARR